MSRWQELQELGLVWVLGSCDLVGCAKLGNLCVLIAITALSPAQCEILYYKGSL